MYSLNFNLVAYSPLHAGVLTPAYSHAVLPVCVPLTPRTISMACPLHVATYADGLGHDDLVILLARLERVTTHFEGSDDERNTWTALHLMVAIQVGL